MQRDRGEGRAVVVHAADEFAGDVLGVGRAAAIAGEQQLAALAQCRGDRLGDADERGGGGGVGGKGGGGRHRLRKPVRHELPVGSGIQGGLLPMRPAALHRPAGWGQRRLGGAGWLERDWIRLTQSRSGNSLFERVIHAFRRCRPGDHAPKSKPNWEAPVTTRSGLRRRAKPTKATG